MKDKHDFSQEYKNRKERIIAALEDERIICTNSSRQPSLAFKLLVVAAAISVLTVGVLAVSRYIEFSAEQNGYEVQIKASITNEDPDNTENTNDRPNLAWNAGEGEVSVKLNLGYMPEDIKTDLASPYKYSNDEFTRAITFIGHDLLINDFEALTAGKKTERLTCGGNECYIVYGGEAAFYDKTLYILFEEEKLVVEAIVSYGISVEELKLLAGNLTISFTENVDEALPISNEKGLEYDPTKVFYSEPNPIYRADMYAIGDTAKHRGYFDRIDTEITVVSAEFTDSIIGLEKSNFFDLNFIEKFVDENGKFVPYARTEFIRGDGVNSLSSFGETDYMTKKMIVLTVKLTGKDYDDAAPFLHSFDLCGFSVEDNGEISTNLSYNKYVYNRTPGTRVGTHNAVYREYIGNYIWKLAYILDEEEITDEIVWFTTKNAIGENLGFIIK